jgi:hypothetical protein
MMMGSLDVSTTDGSDEYTRVLPLRLRWPVLLLLLLLRLYPRPDALVAPDVIGRTMLLLLLRGADMCKVWRSCVDGPKPVGICLIGTEARGNAAVTHCRAARRELALRRFKEDSEDSIPSRKWRRKQNKEGMNDAAELLAPAPGAEHAGHLNRCARC